MVKHIILWQLKDEYSEEEKAAIKAAIKTDLEALQGKIPGLLEIKVQITRLASSNADLMLDSSFEDEAALKGYAVHPEHVKVADEKVRPFTKSRSCLDFYGPVIRGDWQPKGTAMPDDTRCAYPADPSWAGR